MASMVQQASEEYSKVFGATFQDADRRKMARAMSETNMRPTDILLEAFGEWYARRSPQWEQ